MYNSPSTIYNYTIVGEAKEGTSYSEEGKDCGNDNDRSRNVPAPPAPTGSSSAHCGRSCRDIGVKSACNTHFSREALGSNWRPEPIKTKSMYNNHVDAKFCFDVVIYYVCIFLCSACKSKTQGWRV